MARPANDSPADNRTNVQTFRCTDLERDQIKAKAALTGYSVSEFQRRACRDAVVVVWNNAIDKEAVKQLLAIGKNLNQLTRMAHIYEYDRKRVEAVLSKVDTLVMGLLDGTEG